MKVDVRGTDLAAFKAISEGKYNLGSVILAGQDGLSKVNNHRILRNSHVNSAAENRAVREALYRAICDHQRERPLDAECLAAIRAKLGLNETGHVSEAGENAVGASALTRRDIKQIIAFTEQGKTSSDIFKAACEDVRTMIATAQLSEKERIVLKDNLLGPNGKLANWQRVFDTRLVNTLKFIDPQTAPTANAIGDQTSRLAADIRSTCQNFIQSFVTFSETARAQIAAKTDELRNAVNVRIANSELNQLEQNDDEQRETDALFVRLQNVPTATSRLLEGRLLIRLAALSFDDVTGVNVEQAARAFVDGLMPAQDDFLARADNHIALQTQQINTRLHNEALAAKQTVESGLTAMEAKMAQTDEKFTAFQKYLDFLKSTFAELAEKHPRADERLDGDTITAALEDLTNAFNKILEEKTVLAKKVSDESATLTADNVATRQRELSEACERLVAKAQTAIDAKIDALNGKLTLTVVPKFGEDPSAAADATQAKRMKLTEDLEKEWKKASDAFDKSLGDLMGALGSDLDGLESEQRQTIDGLLNDIKARFGEANRKAFVEGHGVGDAKPSDILSKAKIDVLKVVGNGRQANLATMHRSLQANFAVIAKWIAGNEENFAADFKQLTGIPFASLVGDDPGKAEGLRRAVLVAVGKLATDVTTSAQMIRKAKENGPINTILPAIRKKFTEQIARLVTALSTPKLIERAGKEPGIRADVLSGFDQSVAKTLKDLNIQPDSKLESQIKADAARMRRGFEINLLSRYVLEGGSTEGYPEMARNMLASFRDLAEARKLREALLDEVSKEMNAVNQKIFYSKGSPDEKLETQSKILSAVYTALESDGKHVGVENTLPLKELKTMSKKSFFSSAFNVDTATRVLGGTERTMTLAEEAMRMGRDLSVDADLGEAPQVPALNAGLDGLLVDPDVPIEDPRPQPSFDDIILAND